MPNPQGQGPSRDAEESHLPLQTIQKHLIGGWANQDPRITPTIRERIQAAQEFDSLEDLSNREHVSNLMAELGLPKEVSELASRISDSAVSSLDFASDMMEIEISSTFDRLIHSALSSTSVIDRGALQSEVPTKLADKVRFAVRLSMEEILTNHVLHGNRADPRKGVDIEYGRSRSGTFICQTLDQGKGFDASKIRDPTECLARSIPCGRGVLIATAYADTAEQTHEGRGWHLVFGAQSVIETVVRNLLEKNGVKLPEQGAESD